MTTRLEAKQALEAIDRKYQVKMSGIGSFTTCSVELPSNEEIKAEFPNLKELRPTTLGAMMQKKAQKTGVKLDSWKEGLKFPANFFTSNQDINDDFMFIALNCAERDTTSNPDQNQNWSMFHDISSPTNTFHLYQELNQDRFKNCYITDAIKNTVMSNSSIIRKQFELTRTYRGLDKKSILDYDYNKKDVLEKHYIKKFKDFKISTRSKRKLTEAQQRKVEELRSLNKDKDKALELAKGNQETFKKSVDIFLEECLAIQPKRLVALGNDAFNAVHEMRSVVVNNDKYSHAIKKYVLSLIDNMIKFTHYSSPSMPALQDVMNETEKLWRLADEQPVAEYKG